MYAISGTVHYLHDGEWRRFDMPTFYLDRDVQGITSADHALTIARAIVNTRKLNINLNPPTIKFKELQEGDLFIWNNCLWMCYPHERKVDKDNGFFNAVLISSESGYLFKRFDNEKDNGFFNAVLISSESSYLFKRFDNENDVFPCHVEISVTRIG